MPQPEFLANAVGKILEVNNELKEKWSEYFTEAAKYAGLLDEREPGSYQVLSGYIKTPDNIKIENQDSEKVIDSIGKDEIKLTENSSQNEEKNYSKSSMDPEEQLKSQNWGILNFKTLSNRRKAIFAIPEGLTEKDIEALKVFLKGIEVQLDGLRKIED